MRRLIDYDNDGVQYDCGDYVLEDLLIMMQMIIKSGLTSLQPLRFQQPALQVHYWPRLNLQSSVIDKQNHHHVIDYNDIHQ